MSSAIETDERAVTRSASKVMAGGILSLVGGLASNIVVAFVFGAGSSMDAYLTAFVIPSYLQIVFYSSLAFVVIPAFIDAEINRQDEDAWALVGTFFWITTIVLFVLSILGSIFSTSIIHIVAPGFQSEKSTLASKMLAILIFTTPFIGLSTLLSGVQNARNRFFWPSVGPGFGSIANVIILLIFSKFIGPIALCWGYFFSAIVQSGFTIIPVIAHGWKKLLPLTDERIQKLGKSMVPLILFGILTCISPVALRYFSSGLPNGQISYMGYASKISSIFVVILATGIAAAIFPSMARTYAQEGLPGLAQKNAFGLRLTFAVALPVLLIISAVAIPLISVFFERGAFSHSDTYGVSQILFAILLGDVLSRMVSNIFEREFYTLKNTITPPVISSIFVILFFATGRFFVTRWGYIGIVWANVIRDCLGTSTLGILLFGKYLKGNSKNLTINILKYFLAACAAFICGRLVLFALAGASVYIQLVSGGLLSGLLYLMILQYVDREMLTSIFELFGVNYVFGKIKIGIDWHAQRKPKLQ